MTDKDQFAGELNKIELQIANLKNREFELNQLLDKCQSKRWIRANKVTLDDIQISDKQLADSIVRKVPQGMPFFVDVQQFGKWMKETDIQTRYFEWNKRIYHRTEFFAANRLSGGYAAHIKDVPGYVEV